jgi:uncharacterized protein YdiU (UPF0061 family)
MAAPHSAPSDAVPTLPSSAALGHFDDSFARTFPELCVAWQPDPTSAPALTLLNESLAGDLGLDAEVLGRPDGVAVLAGCAIPEGSHPVAQAYAGHQFGGYSPRLGDGRALLLGEITDPAGRRWDVQLKGSGRTPFARGGDGRAALGPMLREYVISEAMAALGIPTTRSLAVCTTGDEVRREGLLPGAVLTRTAASHLRVGTFQYAASLGDPALVRRLVDYAIDAHHPSAVGADDPALALLDATCEVQAHLVAQWMAVGFVHGVLNTDNVTIAGETIDYGPCAFMDRHDPATVFSSIDGGGRYAYGNQPGITLWNLARLAEALLGAMRSEGDAAVAAATEVLDTFAHRYRRHLRDLLATKVGLDPQRPLKVSLVDDLPGVLAEVGVDHTTFFRLLADDVRSGTTAPGDATASDGATALLAAMGNPAAFGDWHDRWRAALADDQRPATEIAAAMDAVNPAYVPRNHLTEAALQSAVDGDLTPLHQLLAVLADPFTVRPGLDAYLEPAPDDAPPYRTFCGT